MPKLSDFEIKSMTYSKLSSYFKKDYGESTSTDPRFLAVLVKLNIFGIWTSDMGNPQGLVKVQASSIAYVTSTTLYSVPKMIALNDLSKCVKFIKLELHELHMGSDRDVDNNQVDILATPNLLLFGSEGDIDDVQDSTVSSSLS